MLVEELLIPEELLIHDDLLIAQKLLISEELLILEVLLEELLGLEKLLILADHWDSDLLAGHWVEFAWGQIIAVIFPGRDQRAEEANLLSLLPSGRNKRNVWVYLGILFPGGLI